MHYLYRLLFVAFIILPSQAALAETFSTSFEFSDADGFTLGNAPLVATFNGGVAQTVGVGAYYHSGAFSWHIPNGSMATISFQSPARVVDFWFRDTQGASSSDYRVFDTEDTIVAEGEGSQSFAHIVVDRSQSPTRIARIEFSSNGGGDSVVDDFSFTALENDEPQTSEILLSLEEPAPGRVYSGVANLRGWALAPQGITMVEFLIDGQLQGRVPYGGSRRDVGNANPGLPNANNGGFSMALGYNSLSVGEHTITVRATDGSGASREQSSSFNVTKFHRNFFGDPNVVNLDNTQLSADDRDIVLENVAIDGRNYDVRLRWVRQSQGFEIVEIR